MDKENQIHRGDLFHGCGSLSGDDWSDLRGQESIHFGDEQVVYPLQPAFVNDRGEREHGRGKGW